MGLAVVASTTAAAIGFLRPASAAAVTRIDWPAAARGLATASSVAAKAAATPTGGGNAAALGLATANRGAKEAGNAPTGGRIVTAWVQRLGCEGGCSFPA